MSFEVNYEEDLVPRIRDLIDGYSKDSILREYLQNADDSGATELVVTFDKRIHASLADTVYEVAKNNSLLIYNNAGFDKKDFEAIVKISAQGKIQDAHSTGRFGQGFSSSFSISDHPSFVSSGRAYWFDVLRNAVAHGKDKSIQGWNLKEDKKEISEWLKTFNIENDQPGATFRLPLRNNDTASQSDISHEVFKFTDFLKWCDEWRGNTSGLLFLRHVQKLVLQEINEHGEKIIHLEIFTKNSKKINKYNNIIQREISSGLLEICRGWKNSSKDLPLFSYKHHFIIKFFDRESGIYQELEESWAVVNGLFRGENNSLVEQAIKVLNISPNPRKVLPWAGVAISLDEKGNVKKHTKSNYHTFLALPIKSNHQVHIHAWFDLNPKRSEITHDGSGDDKEILITWNKLLFKDAIGIAWAHLIGFIKNNCDSKIYYSLWPKNNNVNFDEYLLEGFYKEITKYKCFKTKYKSEKACWKAPKDNIYFLKNNSDKTLSKAFKEHFSIIFPKPTNNIINSLSNIGTDLDEITPEFIREYLDNQSEELEFPFAIGDVPIAMLSKRKWLLPILIFCAEADDDKNFTYLDGLPLELTHDNKVYRLTGNKLLDSNPNLGIFECDKSLFLHSEIIEIVKNAKELPPSWLTPNLKNYLTVLHEHIDNYDLTNKEWLTNLIGMIAQANESEISEAISELHELEVVYQYDRTFAQLISDTDSPFLVQKEEIQNIDYLVKTGMKLVHPEYNEDYRPLLKCNKHKLIKALNSHSLIKHLVLIPKDEYDFFKEKDTREYLIDIFAQDIVWIDDLNEQEESWLNDMPFIATESGNIYAKSEGKKLYLPAGFEPPKHIQNLKGEYEIISVVDDKQHAMYMKMGFAEQNPNNYLKQIIIPFIESSPSVDDIRNISEWLANNWGKLTTDIDDDEKEELICTLSSSEIVLNTDGNLNIAKNYYHPDFFSELPILLQNKTYSILEFEDSSTQKNWSDLLCKLGASREIIPKHIVTTIHSIVDDESDKRATDLLNYISNHFEWFEDMEYDDENIFRYLSKFAWVPTEKIRDNILTPEDKYKNLCKPPELILKQDYMIAGGAHYMLSNKVKLGKKDENGEFSEKHIAKALGLLVKLPNKSVFKSLRRLRNNDCQQQNKELRFAKEFYKYLGRIDLLKKDIPDDITEQSVFIKGKWLSSNRVFQAHINLTGIFCWDELIAKDGKESMLAKGLINLGVLVQPDNHYLVNYLNSLPQNQKLDKQQLKDAKAILDQLLKNREELKPVVLPLVSRTDQLISSHDLFIKDLPAYDKSDNKNDQLNFCQNQFVALAKHCGVDSLADNIKPRLDIDNSKKSTVEDNSWNDYIRSDPFKSAVLRLNYHEGKVTECEIDQESLNKILPSKVWLMESLVVRYSIHDTWIYDDLSTPTYQDNDHRTLYLLNQDDNEDMSESIAKFICDSSKLSIDSFSLIDRILRHTFDYEKINNLLDKKNIKSLPEIIEIDPTNSLFGNNNGVSRHGGENEKSLNKDLGDTHTTSHKNHSTNEDGTTTELIPLNKKHREIHSSVEIPPPITPKTSNSSSMEKTNSTLEGHHSNEHDPNEGNHEEGGAGRNGGLNELRNNRNKLGLNSHRKKVSPNNWKPVYIGREREFDSSKQQKDKERAIKIGNKGESYVLDHFKSYLLSESNKFEKAPTNNMGFDITEIDSNNNIVRYIEVKTLTGIWGEGGVAATRSQLEFAQTNDNWWLFVVENINTQNTTVHIFKNPVQLANRFMFDHSWKQLAETDQKNQLIASTEPIEGDIYRLPDGKYEIINIESKGKLYKVGLKEVQTGKEVTKKFDPSWVNING